MRSTAYYEREKAKKEVDDMLGKTATGNLNDLFETGDNFSSKNKEKHYTDDILNKSQKSPVHSPLYRKEVFSFGNTQPMLKNPTQKYEILDSSDEEVEQETRDRVNLAGRMLEAIPNSAIVGAKEVKVLTLTNNQINRWDKLSYFTNLQTLVLDKNNLKSLSGMPGIKTLKTLWLNNNQIDDFELILGQIKSLFPKLEYLSILRNPINPAIYFGGENEKPYYRFRRRILQDLPNLKVIDTQNVTLKEREDAQTHPKFLIARPEQYDDDTTEDEMSKSRRKSYYDERKEPAAFIGKGRIKYDGRESEGNRFISNLDL